MIRGAIRCSTSQPVNEPTRQPVAGEGGPAPASPVRWAVHFALEGDLRFLSHHDCMRVMERLAVRAGLPLRYSQGFNPHPLLWLLLPRPVGVATQDDLLILALDESVEAQDLLLRLRAHAPGGLRFVCAAPMAGRKTPRPRRAFYELELAPGVEELVRQRLSELQAQAAWSAQRVVVSSRGQRKTSRAIDLRPLVEDLELAGGRLRITLLRQGDAWARPAEVLAILGLEAPETLCRLVRTGCQYEAPSAGGEGLPQECP